MKYRTQILQSHRKTSFKPRCHENVKSLECTIAERNQIRMQSVETGIVFGDNVLRMCTVPLYIQSAHPRGVPIIPGLEIGTSLSYINLGLEHKRSNSSFT